MFKNFSKSEQESLSQKQVQSRSQKNQRWEQIWIAGVDSSGILRFFSDPESKIWKNIDPHLESLFNIGSSRSLCGHFLSKNMGKLKLDR